jgi:hypothetical protein
MREYHVKIFPTTTLKLVELQEFLKIRETTNLLAYVHDTLE